MRTTGKAWTPRLVDASFLLVYVADRNAHTHGESNLSTLLLLDNHVFTCTMYMYAVYLYRCIYMYVAILCVYTYIYLCICVCVCVCVSVCVCVCAVEAIDLVLQYNTCIYMQSINANRHYYSTTTIILTHVRLSRWGPGFLSFLPFTTIYMYMYMNNRVHKALQNIE